MKKLDKYTKKYIIFNTLILAGIGISIGVYVRGIVLQGFLHPDSFFNYGAIIAMILGYIYVRRVIWKSINKQEGLENEQLNI